MPDSDSTVTAIGLAAAGPLTNLKQQWAAASPALRYDVAQQIRKQDPKAFTRWRNLAHMPKVRDSSALSNEMLAALGSALWRGHGPIAKVIFETYFTLCHPEVNSAFLRATKRAGLSLTASDPTRVRTILDELSATAPQNLPGFIPLYEAMLAGWSSGWFYSAEDAPASPSSPAVETPSVKDSQISPTLLPHEAAPALTGPNDSQFSPGVPCRRDRLTILDDHAAALADALADVEQAPAAVRAFAGGAGLDATMSALATLRATHLVTSELAAAFTKCPEACAGAGMGCLSLRTAARMAPHSVAELIKFRPGVAELRASITAVGARANETLAEATRLGIELGDEALLPEARNDSLFDAAASTLLIAAEHTRLSDQLRDRLDNQRQRIQFALDALQPRAVDNQARQDELSALRQSTLNAVELKRLGELQDRITELEVTWRASRSAENIAADLSEHLKLDLAVELVHALIPARPVLAVAFIWLLNATNSNDLLADGDSHAFVESWLDALVAAAGDAAVRRALPALITHSWLPTLRPADVARECLLPLRTLLVALSHVAPDLQPLAHGFHAFESFTPSDFPALASIAERVRGSEKWVLVDTLAAEAVRKAERDASAQLDGVFVTTITKSRKFRRFHEPLSDGIAPLLRRIWEDVRNAPLDDLDVVKRRFSQHASEIEKHIEIACENERSEAFFRKQIAEEVSCTQGNFQHFVTVRARVGKAPCEISRHSFLADLEQLATLHPRWRALFKVAGSLLEEPSARAIPGGVSFIEALFLKHAELVGMVPEIAKTIACTQEWSPNGNDLENLILAIAAPPDPTSVLSALDEGHCCDAMIALVDAWQLSPEVAVQARHRDAEAAAVIRIELFELDPFLDGRVPELRAACLNGRTAYVLGQLDGARARRADADRRSAVAAQERLRELRGTFQRIRDDADESRQEDDWKDRIRKAIEIVLAFVGRAVSPNRVAAEKREAVQRLELGVSTLHDAVHYASHDFIAIDAFVSGLAEAPKAPTLAGSADIDFSHVDTRVELRRAVWNSFEELRRGVNPDSNKGRQLLSGFSKLVFLYCDEDAAEKRVQLVIPPGSGWFASETTFHKPGCDYFDRPVRLQLLSGGKSSTDELNALRNVLDTPRVAAMHTVVLTSGDAAATRKALTRAVRQGRMTLIDSDLLRQIVEAKSPGAPLRQALRRAISVEQTSPFKSEGHVSKEREIYVGRRDLERKITDGRCWAIWGGRRSGKTSLLHAAASAFRKRKDHHTVVYESLESVVDVPLDELDLYVARQLARGLGWKEVPATLDDFAAHIEQQSASTRICLLIDELDAYVKPHTEAGRTDFPLIRHLRRLKNKLSDRFVCIFAGFRHLYRVVRLDRYPQDSAYPWQNWLETTQPLSRLGIDETAELVREGFEDILGMDLEPGVPQRIFKFAGGHPAAIQHFCHCVLRRIAASTRSDAGRRVTEADVESTYQESTGHPGDEPFIRFVEATLDMNLGELERIIIYIIAAILIGRNGDTGRLFKRRDITAAVNELFARGRAPTDTEYDVAFGYLEMTGMLEAADDRFKMAFPSYADILLRLEEVNQDRINDLVTRYLRKLS